MSPSLLHEKLQERVLCNLNKWQHTTTSCLEEVAIRGEVRVDLVLLQLVGAHDHSLDIHNCEFLS